MDAQLLTVPELADQWRCSRAWVYQRIADGTLRTVKLGRSRRVRQGDADAFVAERQAASHAA